MINRSWVFQGRFFYAILCKIIDKSKDGKIGLVMRKILLVLAMGCSLAACGTGVKTKDNVAAGPSPTMKTYAPITVEMIQIGKSGQNGMATIKQEGEKTRVVINLEQSGNASEPAHIHYGVCPKPGAIKYALNDLVKGDSETLLNVPIEEIVASGSMAINVHKSVDDYATYVSCGDIKR